MAELCPRGQGSAGPVTLSEASREQRLSGILNRGSCQAPMKKKRGVRVVSEVGSKTAFLCVVIFQVLFISPWNFPNP